MPTRAATARAVRSLSPVAMTILRPSRCSARIASSVVSLSGSATATSPAKAPPTAMYITVSPASRRPRAASSRLATSIPRLSIMRALPRASVLPATSPLTPAPVTASKFSAAASVRPRSSAPRTIASARGCSEPRSREAVSCRSSLSSKPCSGSMPTSFGLPSVSVPVLSTISVSTAAKRSSASASRMRTPAPAPRPVATMIDIGVARPNAQGQAMISTETAAIRP